MINCMIHFYKQADLLLVLWWMMVITLVEGYSRNDLQKLYPGFGTEFVIFPDENNSPILGYLKFQNDSRIVPEQKFDFGKDIQFQFFSREYPNGVYLKPESDLNNYVNPNRTTKCITHGWMSGGSKDTCVLIKDGFLYKYDANIFIMDWSPISGNPFYPIAMMATPKVGKYYGTYLNYLIEKTGINPKDIHLVGHSLGAHVSGFAGREVKQGKIGRISGLDPALPGFDVGLVSAGTLGSSDADFVDVIHTCAGYLGYKTPLGHADFYPNGGGPPQPGCSILQFIEACSHGRSWKIYASSLISKEPFVATKCSIFSELEESNICHGETSFIGDPTPLNTRGVYYSKILDTDLILSTSDKNKT